MRNVLIIMIFTIFQLSSCAQKSSEKESNENIPSVKEIVNKTEEKEILNIQGNILQTRFNPPKGFKRNKVEVQSFATYLRDLPLKKHGEKVKYYNGETKPNYNTYQAVVDQSIGRKDLHQCADAVMRLRAEYFYNQKLYDKIHFNFTNGFRVDYSKWMEGNRMVVKGKKTYWKHSQQPSNSYKDFWNYMELIFMYAGTWSLEKELLSVSIENMQIGDVFIQGGSPGHAVIVVDMAENITTGEKVFMLAQSYMPAQELQILQNPNKQEISPWYSLNFGNTLNTPEWTFYKNNLKRFED